MTPISRATAIAVITAAGVVLTPLVLAGLLALVSAVAVMSGGEHG